MLQGNMRAGRDFIDPNIARKDKFVEGHFAQHAEGGGPPIFSLIEFNLSGLCSRKCVFCPRVDPKIFPNVDRHMSLGLYEKVMKDLAKVRFDGTVLYSAFSEPLLYKGLEKIIRLSKDCCPDARIEIVSNGDLATGQRLSALFNAGLATFSVSMYDGPHQVEHFRRLQAEAGLRDDQMPLRVRWLSPEEHFGITLSNRAGAVAIKDIGIVPLKRPLKRPCYYPFYQILVDYDGSVLLCAHDWARRLIAGNVNDDSILTIWDNDVLKRVRRKLIKSDRGFPPCSLCDAKGILIGKKHFDKWGEYYEKKSTKK